MPGANSAAQHWTRLGGIARARALCAYSTRGARDRREAIREGYNRVYSTILDANLTNLIVCAVLLLMQPTTEVKGFALTLTIGILAKRV